MRLPKALIFAPLALASRREQSPLVVLDHHDEPRVNVTLYVMSRCSDARLCEDVFDDVLQTKGILDKVDLHFNFIGRTNASEHLGVTCKHGPLECIGNAHDLCLYNHLDLATFYAHLSCQNFDSPFPGDIGKLSRTRQCSDAVGVDWKASGVGRCIQGEKMRKGDGEIGGEALRLLRANIAQTEKQGVTKSCTIRIDSVVKKGGLRECVVDDGVWKGCDDGHTAADFVRVIEEEWDHLRSSA